MEKFWDLLAQSVLVQGLLTLGVTCVVCYLAVIGKETPKELWTLLGMAWGFYFGTKAQQSMNSYIAKLRK